MEIQSKRRMQLQVGLDPELRRKAEVIAEKNRISLAEVFRRALLAYQIENN